MSCMIKEIVKQMNDMTDKQLIEYAEKSTLLEGKELVLELVHRLRSKKSEIYHLHGRIDSVVKRHTGGES